MERIVCFELKGPETETTQIQAPEPQLLFATATRQPLFLFQNHLSVKSFFFPVRGESKGQKGALKLS